MRNILCSLGAVHRRHAGELIMLGRRSALLLIWMHHGVQDQLLSYNTPILEPLIFQMQILTLPILRLRMRKPAFP